MQIDIRIGLAALELLARDQKLKVFTNAAGTQHLFDIVERRRRCQRNANPTFFQPRQRLGDAGVEQFSIVAGIRARPHLIACLGSLDAELAQTRTLMPIDEHLLKITVR